MKLKGKIHAGTPKEFKKFTAQIFNFTTLQTCKVAFIHHRSQIPCVWNCSLLLLLLLLFSVFLWVGKNIYKFGIYLFFFSFGS